MRPPQGGDFRRSARRGYEHLYGYRWYDPLTGRWPSRDPIGEDGGLNLYEMCHNSSISWFDGDGWQPATITITGVLGGTTKDEPNFTWTQESTYTGRTRTPNAKASFSMEFTITKEGCVINVVAKANFEIGASPRAYFKQKFADYSEPDGAELIEAIKVFNKGIAEKWNGKFKICCQSFSGIWVEKGIPATVTDSTKCCCDVKFSVAHDKNAMRVGVYKSATPYSDESNWNSQTNAQGVAAHEFGHLLAILMRMDKLEAHILLDIPTKYMGARTFRKSPDLTLCRMKKGLYWRDIWIGLWREYPDPRPQKGVNLFL